MIATAIAFIAAGVMICCLIVLVFVAYGAKTMEKNSEGY